MSTVHQHESINSLLTIAAVAVMVIGNDSDDADKHAPETRQRQRRNGYRFTKLVRRNLLPIGTAVHHAVQADLNGNGS